MGRAIHFVVCSALVSSCSGSKDGNSVRTVDSTRVVSEAGVDFRDADSTAGRFGLGGPSKAPTAAMGATSASPSPFAWTLPAGWTELPTTSMRTANFRPAGEEHAECYLTLLSGDAGGLGANVNRWRAQLALPALSPTEIDALPKSTLLGRDATVFEATGTWKGMNATESSPNWGLVGLLVVEPGGSAFLKMTGPEEVVHAQRDALLELAQSFRSAKIEAHGDEIHGAPAGGGDFAFDLPAGWRKAPDRPMRNASFFAGPGEDLECYVTVFPGEAGGILANVNRWRGQLGEGPLAESDLSSLHRIPMLGRQAVLVECSGKGSQLVGAACAGADRSVFVKMSGPPDRVQEQRSAFLSFCASIRNGN